MKKRILSLLLCLCMVLVMAPAAMATEPGEKNCQGGNNCQHDAAINGTHYNTLNDAVAAVNDSTDTTILILHDVTDAKGLSVPEGKKITFDFQHHTYTLSAPGAGSQGTETNGFQLLKDSTIVMKNGTIKIAESNKNQDPTTESEPIKRIIQNYADLTLENMQIYAANQYGGEDYALSFNYGDVVFRGNTNIFTTEEDVTVFDVYFWHNGTYDAGVSVTFDSSMTGTIGGNIEVAAGGDSTSIPTDSKNATLTINGGTVAGDITNNVDDMPSTVKISGASIVQGTVTSNEKATTTIEGTAKVGAISGENITVSGDAEVEKTEGNHEASVTSAGSTVYYEKFEDAIENVKENGTITLLRNVTVDEGVYLVNEGGASFPDGVTIDGGSHSITASDAFKKNTHGQINLMKLQGTNNVTLKNLTLKTTEDVKHALDLYDADKVTLENVTLNHENCIFNDEIKGGAPLIINQSDVTVKGTFNVIMGENSWYGINVDDKNTPGSASITFADGVKATFTDKSMAQNKAPIYVEESTDPTTAVMNPENAGLVQGENGEFEVKPEEPVVTPPPANPSYSITTPAAENGKVTVSPTSAKAGAKVTITVTPDDGFELDELTVTRGSTAVTVTKNSDGTYSFTMPQGSVTVTATFVCDGGDKCPSAPFTDVNTSLWYHEEIDYVVENGLMNGDSPTTFAPQRELSRAELAQILYNKEGRPAVEGDMVFADVPAGEWFYPAILWANQEEVVGGDSPTTFVPNRAITREELAVMLYRYAGKPAASGSLKDFTDGDEVSTWAEDAMVWAVTEGIISGDTPTTLDPGDGATRAEAAAMLMRFCENVEQ